MGYTSEILTLMAKSEKYTPFANETTELVI
jgi:hypothetical protein